MESINLGINLNSEIFLNGLSIAVPLVLIHGAVVVYLMSNNHTVETLDKWPSKKLQVLVNLVIQFCLGPVQIDHHAIQRLFIGLTDESDEEVHVNKIQEELAQYPDDIQDRCKQRQLFN